MGLSVILSMTLPVALLCTQNVIVAFLCTVNASLVSLGTAALIPLAGWKLGVSRPHDHSCFKLTQVNLQPTEICLKKNVELPWENGVCTLTKWPVLRNIIIQQKYFSILMFYSLYSQANRDPQTGPELSIPSTHLFTRMTSRLWPGYRCDLHFKSSYLSSTCCSTRNQSYWC